MILERLVTVLSVLGTGIPKRMQRRKMLISFLRAFLIFPYRTANACYKDAADLLAELEQYPQAIARYEQVADHSLTSALTKYSVKEYWLRAGLCALAMNVWLSFGFVAYLP